MFLFWGGKYNKQLNELQSRLQELDDDLAVERQSRAKAEKIRQILFTDVADLGEKLEDSGNNTVTQIEINRRREEELARLRSELEESNMIHESTLATLRIKHNQNMCHLRDKIDELFKAKAKVDRDKAHSEHELQQFKASLDQGSILSNVFAIIRFGCKY